MNKKPFILVTHNLKTNAEIGNEEYGGWIYEYFSYSNIFPWLSVNRTINFFKYKYNNGHMSLGDTPKWTKAGSHEFIHI